MTPATFLYYRLHTGYSVACRACGTALAQQLCTEQPQCVICLLYRRPHPGGLLRLHRWQRANFFLVLPFTGVQALPPMQTTAGRTQEGYSDFMSGVWDSYARARDSAGWTWDEAQVGSETIGQVMGCHVNALPIQGRTWDEAQVGWVGMGRVGGCNCTQSALGC